jgi:hypothetical protein
MEKIDDTHIKALDKIKKSVEVCRDSNKENNDRFNRYRSFVLETTISQEDANTLQSAGKPVAEVNVIESIFARLWGEWSKQTPNIMVRGTTDNVNPMQVDIVEAIIRYIFTGGHYENMANETFKDTTTGGFSVWRVKTNYENEKSMDQCIQICRVFDPTLTGFDPLSNYKNKSDSKFCFELIPKYKEELEEEYPDIDFSKIKQTNLSDDGSFRWIYKQDNKEILYVCDYYTKKYTYITMYEISDPRHPDVTHSIAEEEYEKLLSTWDSIIEPPQIINKARRKKTTIWRYQFIGDILLETPEETDYDHLPLVFFDGSSVTIKRKQITRPLSYNVIDAQRAKNLAFSNILNDMENTRETDVLIAISSLPEQDEFKKPWLSNKRNAALVWNNVGPDGQQNPPPAPFPRTQPNPIFVEIFNQMDTTIQTILGTYDAQLGVQKSQISGEAIKNGASQSNNSSMPFVTSYISSLNHVAQIVVSLIPKYYKTMRTVPVMLPSGKHSYRLINDSQDPNGVSMDYDHNDLQVVVTAGANFDVQREKSMETMIELMKVMPSVAALMNQKGLPWMLDNIELRGKEHIKQMAEQFMSEQEKKAAEQGNPQEAMMQAQMKLEQQKLQLAAQKQQGDMMIASEKLKQSEDQATQNQRLELMKLLSDIENEKSLMMIRMEESKNEAERTQTDMAIKIFDSAHSKIETMINGALRMKEHHENRKDKLLSSMKEIDNFGY